MTEQYDAMVIGSGQGGKPLSIALAKAGWKTALIERGYIGGTCINTGCTPTKTMVASARVAYLSRRSADYGVHTGPVTVNLGEVRRRKQQIVESFRNGSLSSVEKTADLDLLKGEASFTGSNSIEVRLNEGGTRLLAAGKIFINTGGRSSQPPIPGLDTVPFLDSTSIMELDVLPEHLLVLGGSYIGLEFGQMFRRFGSRVTVIQRGKRLLSREDPDLTDAVATIVAEDGVTVQFITDAVRVEQAAGQINLIVRTSDGEKTLTGSHLLVAVGRTPNTEQLNLAAAGVKTDSHGFVEVNERLETSASGIYAMGDVKGGAAFTHISYDDFRIIRTNLLEGGNATTSKRLVPYTVFIDPQLGRVGLSETEARAQGLKIRVAKLPMTQVARAIEVGETRGFIKAVVDATTNQILGCAVLGIEGGEVMSMLEIAMMGQIPYTVLKDAIFAHPTLAESLNNLFMAMEAQ
ncbi:MAG TPA: mercuric reductase [Blastocatellia bacterium]|jgi:pyruvate/2-oxoglutarate dehydrogenase complex dihydrolipoamide dehydrogenase (E3) component|nr:mercuric reductase [Blastocatellia bacterium]